MNVWSGKPTNCYNFKVFITLAFMHIKQEKIDGRVVKRVFFNLVILNEQELQVADNGKREGSGFIISINIIFDETNMWMKCKDLLNIHSETK